MPTIRVDRQVRAYLAGRGGAGDALNDVRRRERWRGATARRRGRPPKPAAAERPPSRDDLAPLLDRHLPARWRSSPARMAQILMLVRTVLDQPAGRGIAEREQAARAAVAERLGIDPNSVLDKCGRQLFGTGGDQLARFRAALESIERTAIERAAGDQPGAKTSY